VLTYSILARPAWISTDLIKSWHREFLAGRVCTSAGLSSSCRRRMRPKIVTTFLRDCWRKHQLPNKVSVLRARAYRRQTVICLLLLSLFSEEAACGRILEVEDCVVGINNFIWHNLVTECIRQPFLIRDNEHEQTSATHTVCSPYTA
jgi:hypothetical protein